VAPSCSARKKFARGVVGVPVEGANVPVSISMPLESGVLVSVAEYVPDVPT